ncbi:MAG TPA: hypothetical protein VMW20_06465 [Candidatus Nanoarchaeia archaeon]|nr:hypothetical protein [Candidatus Nanoarchaeia archaeon]
MRRITIAIIIAIILVILLSGCLGEKTVIKANVKITGQDGTPVIENMVVSQERVSRLEVYREGAPHFPGVSMKCISNMIQIDYWRSVEYNGAGEYELISELLTMPDKGDSVDVIIEVVDDNGKQMAKRTETIIWR